MKKILLCTLGLFLALTIAFAGGSSESGGAKQVHLVMATGGTSGTYYPYGGAVGQVLSETVPGLNVNIQSTGASAANIRLVSTNEADIGVVQNDVMSYAYTGTEIFEGEQITGFATMATVYAEVCQIIADPDSGIKTIADLKGKRVSIGDAGSGVEANSIQILAEYGISLDDITEQNLGFGDSASALKDKKIDAFFVTAGTPTTAIVELSTTNDVVVIAVDGAQAQALVEKYPFYTTYTIPAGTYNGMDSDVNTLAVKATLIVNADLDEELVYNMTKALFEEKETIAQAHAKGKELSAESAVQGASVPFHPGALRYFTEIGVIK